MTGTEIGLWIAIAVIAILLVVALVVGLVRYRRRQIRLSSTDTATPIDRSGGYTTSSGITFSKSAPAEPVERIDTSGLPAVGDDATIPRDAPKRPIADVQLPDTPVREAGLTLPETAPPPVAPPAPPPVAPPPVAPPAPPPGAPPAPPPGAPPAPPPAAVAPPAPPPVAPPPVEEQTPAAVEEIAPTEGRLGRLRGRLAKSQNTLGRSMLGLLGGGDLDEESWEEVEDTLLIADLGPVATESVVTALRSRMASSRVRTEADARAVLREVLDRRAAARSRPLDQGAAAR